MSRSEAEREVRRIEAGGDAWAEDDEVVEVEVKQPLDKVVPVRLSSEKWAALHREARELGVGPTTLARMWILEKLREKAVPPELERRREGQRPRRRAPREKVHG